MIHLITYGDDKYARSKSRLNNEANSTGWFDSVTLYGSGDLDDEFKSNVGNVLNQRRGGGYWTWKPYIVQKHLNKINEGDILIYLDSGCTINPHGKERFNEYIKMLNNSEDGCISFQLKGLLENTFTIKEIFNHFGVIEDDEITKTGQIIAGILILKKNSNSVNLVNLWNKTLCENPLLFTDYYNTNQSSQFRDNRHDQSIFSVIRKMHKTTLLNDETLESLKFPFWATRKR
jgi:hypothetical protein